MDERSKDPRKSLFDNRTIRVGKDPLEDIERYFGNQYTIVETKRGTYVFDPIELNTYGEDVTVYRLLPSSRPDLVNLRRLRKPTTIANAYLAIHDAYQEFVKESVKR